MGQTSPLINQECSTKT